MATKLKFSGNETHPKKEIEILNYLPCDTAELSKQLNLSPKEICDLLKDNIFVVPPWQPDGSWYLSSFGQELIEIEQKKRSNSKIQDIYFEKRSIVERGRIIAMPEKDDVPLLINGCLEHLKEKYLTWLKNDVHFAIKKTLSISCSYEKGATNFYEKSKIVFRRAAKRGNNEYIQSIKERIKVYNERLPIIRFFNPRKREMQKTSMLYIVLTTNPRKFKSRYDAWLDIGKRINKFTSNLKRYFDCNIHSSHSWECFYKKAKGYPHVNLIIYLKEKEVSCFSMKTIDKKTGEQRIVWRMKKKHDLEKYWDSGFIDVYAISQVKGIDEDYIDDLNTEHPIRDGSMLSVTHMLKYVTKNIRDNDVDEKTVLLNSILWALRKRSFSLSNMFMDMAIQINEDINSVSDLINRLSNSNIFPRMVVNVTIKYELLGVYPACSLNCSKLHDGKPPPSCPYHKINDGWGKCCYEKK